MTSLRPVSKALEEAVRDLPEAAAIADVAYLVDVSPSGADSLVVYVVLKNTRQVPTDKERAVETKLRDALRRALDFEVYFRWRTADEHAVVAMMGGLIDQPVSAMR